MKLKPCFRLLTIGILLSTLALACLEVPAQAIDPEIMWQHTWGGRSFDSGEDVTTDETHVYMAGMACSFGAEEGLAFVAKLDKKGNLIWDRTWGVSHEYADAVVSDGSNVYIAGTTNISYPTKRYDIFLAKFNSNGQLQWDKTWGGNQTESVGDMATNGTHLFIVGTTYSFGTTGDAFIAAFGADGTLKWDRNFGTDSTDSAQAVLLTGPYLYVAGHMGSVADGDAYLAKFDTQGNPKWLRRWRRSMYDEAWSLATDGVDLYVAGVTNSSTTDRDALLAKFNANGDLLWDRTWGGDQSEDAYGVATYGKYVFITGLTFSFTSPNAAAFVAGFSPDGAPLLDRIWGEGQGAGAYGINSDGISLYVTGLTKTFPHPLIGVNANITDPDAIIDAPETPIADPAATVGEPNVTAGDPAATIDSPTDIEAFILRIGPWIVGGEVIPPNSAALLAPPIALASLVALFVVATRRLIAKSGNRHV